MIKRQGALALPGVCMYWKILFRKDSGRSYNITDLLFLFFDGCCAQQVPSALSPTVQLIPFGTYESTDQKDNFANYRSSLRLEFPRLTSSNITGKTQHQFSPAAGGQNNSFVHSFWVVGSSYKQTIPFELDKEATGTYNGTPFKVLYLARGSLSRDLEHFGLSKTSLGTKLLIFHVFRSVFTDGLRTAFKYYLEQGLGLHVVYNIPVDNPMQVQHAYTVTDDGFTLTYKLGDVMARRWYRKTKAPGTVVPPKNPAAANKTD